MSQMNYMQSAYCATADALKDTHLHLKTAPHELSAAYLINDQAHLDVPIIFDTGCSVSLTPFQEDFVTELDTTDCREMAGLADSVAVSGIGWTRFHSCGASVLPKVK